MSTQKNKKNSKAGGSTNNLDLPPMISQDQKSNLKKYMTETETETEGVSDAAETQVILSSEFFYPYNPLITNPIDLEIIGSETSWWSCGRA